MNEKKTTRKAKSTAILTTALAVTAALTACGANSPSASAPAAASASAAVSANAAASKAGKTVVTVSVPTEDRLMQQAEQMFEQAHPDIDIQIHAAAAASAGGGAAMQAAQGGKAAAPIAVQPGQDDAAREKYRTTVNTALMSGSADDLIAIQDLDYGAYADKGLLADLEPYLGKDSELQSGDVSTQVLDAVRWHGQRLALPIDFALDLMVGNQEAIAQAGVKIDDAAWTWDQFFDLGKQIVQADGKQQAILTVGSELDLFSAMLQSTYSQYVDSSAGKASFDSAEFVKLLTSIKDLTDQGLVRTGADKSADDLFKTINAISPTVLLLFPQMYYNGQSKVYYEPGAGGGIAFTPDLMFAMNAKSQVKDAAWQFLQFLLSDPIQSLPGISGLPVRQSSLVKTIDSLTAKLGSGNVTVQTKDGSAAQQPTVTDADKQAVEQIVAQAGTYIYEDSQVMAIARDEADAFFKGEKSAEDAAKLIQNRVTTYLNE